MQLFSFAKRIHKKETVHKPLIETPMRAWHMFLRVFLGLVIIAVAYGVLTYYRVVNNIYADQVELQKAREPINRAKLESVLERYEKKKGEFEMLKTREEVVKDPSVQK